MYLVFAISESDFICVRDKYKDSKFLLSAIDYVLPPHNPFILWTQNRKYDVGYTYVSEGGLYLHMHKMRDDCSKFGLLSRNRGYFGIANIIRTIEDFSLEDSEIGDLYEIIDMVLASKSTDDLLFCLRLAIPILHKYDFNDLLVFQTIYNEHFNLLM